MDMQIDVDVLYLSAGKMMTDTGEIQYASIHGFGGSEQFNDQADSTQWGLKPTKIKIDTRDNNAISKKIAQVLQGKKPPLKVKFSARMEVGSKGVLTPTITDLVDQPQHQKAPA